MKRTKASSAKAPSFRNVAERLAFQRQQTQAARLARESQERAQSAKAAFKPRKSDRGKLVFIGTKGQRNPQGKGRKGYPVYVTRTGKKWLIKQRTEKPFKARTLSELVLPARSNLRNAIRGFQERRLERIGKIRTITRRTGTVKTGGNHDFNEHAGNAVAKSIRDALAGQASHRIFLVKFNVLVKLPDGTTEAITGEVPIERADHIAIKLAGIRNFVRQKFYSFMARELAYTGYVSNGSANHIRSLAANKGKSRDKWVDKRGDLWAGRNKQQVEILTIEWKIEQAK